MVMVDGHVAFEKEADFGWDGQGVQVGMVDGHEALGQEEDSGWEGQGV